MEEKIGRKNWKKKRKKKTPEKPRKKGTEQVEKMRGKWCQNGAKKVAGIDDKSEK